MRDSPETLPGLKSVLLCSNAELPFRSVQKNTQIAPANPQAPASLVLVLFIQEYGT